MKTLPKHLMFLPLILFLVSCDATLRFKKEAIGFAPKQQCSANAIHRIPSLRLDNQRLYKPDGHPNLIQAEVTKITWTDDSYPMTLLLAVETCKDGTHRTVLQLQDTVSSFAKNKIKDEFEKISSQLITEIQQQCDLENLAHSMQDKFTFKECDQ